MVFREGRCGEGTSPLRWVAEDASIIGGWRQGGNVLPFADSQGSKVSNEDDVALAVQLSILLIVRSLGDENVIVSARRIIRFVRWQAFDHLPHCVSIDLF